MATNLTEVRLLNVPFGRDYKHTPYFKSAADQASEFSTLPFMWLQDLSYQRKEGIIRVPKQYDQLLSYNYVMYKNHAQNPNKWFYAFIRDMKYISEGMTEVYIETDVMQTWLEEMSVKECFVEREHVNDDTIGMHTVPENLETGEYICNFVVQNQELKSVDLVVATTVDISNYTNQPDDWNATKEFAPAYGDIYNGVYSGLRYYRITPEGLGEALKCLAYEGQDSAVHSVFYAPTLFFPTTEEVGQRFEEVVIPSTTSARTYLWDVMNKPTNLNGHTVRNKKLFTFPYSFMTLDNGGGGSVQYHYEKFAGDKVNFGLYGVLTPGCSIRAIPYQYNGLSGYTNQAEGLNLSKYSTCSWTTDAYTSWLAQNGVNVAIGTVGSVAAMVGGIAAAPMTGGASLAIAGAVAGGIGAIGSQVASVYQHSMTPPQVSGNTNGGDVATAAKQVTFTAYDMSIKKEYAEIIDHYFDMFGYKVNQVKIPNKAHRRSYWYTKTIDANIVGNIPQEDLQKIKDCYNRGITFWRIMGGMGIYSQSNTIV